jgi:hypothetical protein
MKMACYQIRKKHSKKINHYNKMIISTAKNYQIFYNIKYVTDFIIC